MFHHRHDHGGDEELVEKRPRRACRSPRSARTAAGSADRGWRAGPDDLRRRARVRERGGRHHLRRRLGAACLAITDDAYIVVAANAFALLGLRPLVSS
jgi:hypothetical protein